MKWFDVVWLASMVGTLYCFLKANKHAWQAGYCHGRVDQITGAPLPDFLTEKARK